jgi:hypothetical protein
MRARANTAEQPGHATGTPLVRHWYATGTPLARHWHATRVAAPAGRTARGGPWGQICRGGDHIAPNFACHAITCAEEDACCLYDGRRFQRDQTEHVGESATQVTNDSRARVGATMRQAGVCDASRVASCEQHAKQMGSENYRGALLREARREVGEISQLFAHARQGSCALWRLCAPVLESGQTARVHQPGKRHTQGLAQVLDKELISEVSFQLGGHITNAIVRSNAHASIVDQ